MANTLRWIARRRAVSKYWFRSVARYILTEGMRSIDGIVAPAPRIVVRVPATAKIEIGDLLASVGRCIAAANGDREVRLQPHEFDLCLTLAAILGGSGWERLRIASLEENWESTVHLVPKKLRENLSALARAHLKSRSVGKHH